MKIAKLPDGRKLAFDDDTPQSHIDAEVKRYISLTKAKAPSSTTPEIVVNVPDIHIPPINMADMPSPNVTVEVKHENPKEFETLVSHLGEALKDIRALTQEMSKLNTAISTNSKNIQNEVRASAKMVAVQMQSAALVMEQSTKTLYDGLTKSKTIELDNSGNPVRIRIEK